MNRPSVKLQANNALTASPPIQLIVGLGNPGDAYTHTRHNAGVWFVEQLAAAWKVTLHQESKFHGRVATADRAGVTVRLLIPTTFMNASGQAVRAISQFYHLPAAAILVAHDELDFPPGVVRLKQEGGHGGHNGLRDIMQHIHANDFNRLRIGIGHPGHRSQTQDYVLSAPNRHDQQLITAALEHACTVLPELLQGDIQAAMKKLHTENI